LTVRENIEKILGIEKSVLGFKGNVMARVSEGRIIMRESQRRKEKDRDEKKSRFSTGFFVLFSIKH